MNYVKKNRCDQMKFRACDRSRCARCIRGCRSPFAKCRRTKSCRTGRTTSCSNQIASRSSSYCSMRSIRNANRKSKSCRSASLQCSIRRDSGEIELRDDPIMLLRPEVADPLLKFPACEFDATEGEFDPRDAPAAPEHPNCPRTNDPSIHPPPNFRPRVCPPCFRC